MDRIGGRLSFLFLLFFRSLLFPSLGPLVLQVGTMSGGFRFSKAKSKSALLLFSKDDMSSNAKAFLQANAGESGVFAWNGACVGDFRFHASHSVTNSS